MNPTNYSTAAIEFITEVAAKAMAAGDSKTAVAYKVTKNALEDSVKFLLPDGGIVIDSNLGAVPEEFRLPYHRIALEYSMLHAEFHPDASIRSSRRIAMAEELSPKDVESIREKWHALRDPLYDKGAVQVFSITYADEFKVWNVYPFSAIIPVTLKQTIHTIKDISDKELEHLPDWAKRSGKKAYSVSYLPIMPIDYLLKRMDYKELIQAAYIDLSDEIQSVVNLVEALSCKNVIVAPGPSQEKLNKSRVKKGKKPFFEYKVLTIEASSLERKYSERRISDRESPRQHLRRGHVRHLDRGNIWIPSTLVGDPDKGKIDKSYLIKGTS